MFEVSLFSYFLLVIYFIIGSMTVLNLLIGVLCEVAGSVAEAETEAMSFHEMKGRILDLMGIVDVNSDGSVTITEFKDMIEDKNACNVLKDVGVDVYSLVDNAEFVFYEKDALNFDDFFNTVLRFRDEKSVTV